MTLRLFGYACLGIICSAILVTASVLAWWIADRKLPVHLISSEVLTKHVEPCGTLEILQTIDYIDDAGAHVDRAIFDSDHGRQFLLDIDYEHPPQGLGIRMVKTIATVPCAFVPGDATYEATPAYWRNPLQRYYWPITREKTVLTFKIVPRSESGIP